MAQVMHNKRILFEEAIYVVSLTWDEQEPVVAIQPDNPALTELVRKLALSGQPLRLRDHTYYQELIVPGA